MKYWITTDTHFGHDKLMEYSGRPENFSDIILRGFGVVAPEDVFIHLGDICIGMDTYWHALLNLWVSRRAKKWLLLGNHDRQSKTWYISHGWDFVATAIELDIFGKKVVLSHKPVEDYGFDMNIHGHFHNSNPERHEDDLKRIKTGKHKLIYLEHNYQLIDLRKLCQN